MVFGPRGGGYDHAITVFSPDGSLYQVSYAAEAVKKGSTAIGVKCNEGIVLAVDKSLPSNLVEAESFEKIFQIDDHMATASSGIIADARVLVDRARIQAQVHKLTYDEDISIMALTKSIGDLKQMHTQYGGLRPFGVSLIIAGVDSEGPQIFVTEPSGAFLEWKATAIGSGKPNAMDYFEKEYEPTKSIEESIVLALKVLRRSMDSEMEASNIEVVEITTKDRKFRRLTPEELKGYISKLPDESEEESEEDSESDNQEED
ncbi:MAG: archaeal proteasome endopeptidase complex subunit alpha [Candidatus Methanofastidiosa archaeon]|nr:archaeal proteasome endopeptidase complex subunit alpha [Candidatus Methanofastidiosa archaeon]